MSMLMPAEASSVRSNSPSVVDALESDASFETLKTYRVTVISSVPPDPTRIAGALILYRWLNHPRIEWIYLEPPEKAKSLIWRVLDRLTRTRFNRIAVPLIKFYEGNALAVHLRHKDFYRHCLQDVGRDRPDLILGIAHGHFYKIAHRVSKQLGVPLILLAQDWWPAFVKGGAEKQQREEKDFIRILSDTDATIAVSEGMFHELGRPQNAIVLHDIPSENARTPARTFQPSDKPLKIIYAGNTSTYGPMIEQAARACMKSDSVRMEIYGRPPIRWSEGTEEEFREAGIFRGFVSPEAFPKVADSYDFVLAIMSFDPALRQRMKTCFLSKIIELAQLGKPIVVWGPEEGSAAVWAQRTGAALAVTDPSPESFFAAVEALAHNPAEQTRLAHAIRAVAEKDFNPEKIRRDFMGILERVSRNS